VAEVVIELEGVEKAYDGTAVLGPLSLRVAAGLRLAVVGPSGCGKSTLLRVILGLLRPERGRVFLGREELRPENKRALRRRIGYVVQDGGLFPHLTAERNVAVVARYMGWTDSQVRGRVGVLAEMVALERGVLSRWPAELSGGQRQRVGIMRALMLDPDVLLMDEPLGALDPSTRTRLQRELSTLFRELQKTVVLVTHDLGEAAYLAEETAVMRQGRIVQRDRFDDLLRAPADEFVRELLSSRGP
jgi:osmoprotectant transport system ATP-binding protein